MFKGLLSAIVGALALAPPALAAPPGWARVRAAQAAPASQGAASASPLPDAGRERSAAPVLGASVSAGPASPATGKAGAVGPRRILLQRTAAVGVPGELARSLEEVLLIDVGRRSGIIAISPSELEQTLQFETDKVALGCDELDACVTEVQRRLGADQLISAKLGRLGPDYALAIALIDLTGRRVVGRVAAQSPRIGELRQAVPALLDELLGAGAPSQGFALEKGKELQLAVVPLAALGVPASTADAMSQILAVEYSRIEGVSVISQDDVRAMLRQVESEVQLGCTDNLACVAEIGAALGLSKLVAGSVGKVDQTYLIALRLIDTRKVVVLNRVLESFDSDPLELRHAIKKAARDLLGIDASGSTGGLDVTLNVPAGTVQLGERRLAFDHYRFSFDGLAPGRYPLGVVPAAPDYLPLRRDIYVPAGTRNVRSLELAPVPSRWHEHWWVWAIAGGVVAAAAATTVWLDADGPRTGSADVELVGAR